MNFVDKLAPFAVKHGLANGVLPSLIIAQGILESGSGTSELAKNANNLFGIKAGSGWTGPTYTKRTSEQDEDGNVYYINAAFRKYPSYEGCVMDLVHKYTHGTGWEDHNRYAAILNQTDYRKATAALHAAGYATDIKYAAKLNERIEQYGLTKYDKEVIDMVKIFIDPGHGGTDSGAVGNGLKEKDLTLAISKRIESLLTDYEGVQVKLSRTTDQTLSLKQRTDTANAWKADFLLSVHINAGGGKGYEDFIFNGKVSNKTIDFQAVLHSEITKMIPEFINRGKKRKNLHMVRESHMPSILTESGFIDSPDDSELLKSDEFLNRVALGHVNGIVKAFDLKKKDASTSTPAKEDGDLKFTSGTLKKEFETFLNSKAQREIAVREAVKQGYNAKWIKDLEEGKASDGDIAMLAIGALIKANK
ncbi:N-acetylmuramoyl-L-alanine amidase [Sporosarcina koreensis]|uniref:N-acetylmuramoyl-L-alanine amidase n=1 Tax=Sporosarcina koreensis TaxID=334735 RepID=UPI0009E740FE|nr:N-acetylmuramoyl-L-alanine amidase [Sporosarcina koreensis]